MQLTKENLGWPTEPPFYIPDEALRAFPRGARSGASEAEAAWNATLRRLRARHFPSWPRNWSRLMRGELPAGWDADIPVFPADAKGMATRVAVGQGAERHRAAAARADRRLGRPEPFDQHRPAGPGRLRSPGLRAADAQGAVGGDWSYAGRNLHFGVREHAMGAIMNGMAAHGGIIPFGATFLDLLRLHAPGDPPGGADGAARDLRLHPRQHRRWARTARPTSRSSSWPACARSPA